MWFVSSDGGNEKEIGPETNILTDWLPDGLSLLIERRLGILLGRIGGEWPPKALPGVPAEAGEDQASSDGKYLAYSLTDRGQIEVYVQAFGSEQGRWQVSQGGGRQPQWRGDGKELFYWAPDGSMMAAEIQTGQGVEVIARRALFDAGVTLGIPRGVGSQYAVTSNGQRFIFPTNQVSERTPITVIQNVGALLSRK